VFIYEDYHDEQEMLETWTFGQGSY